MWVPPTHSHPSCMSRGPGSCPPDPTEPQRRGFLGPPEPPTARSSPQLPAALSPSWLRHSHVCPKPSGIRLCRQLEPPLGARPFHTSIPCCVAECFRRLVLNLPPSWLQDAATVYFGIRSPLFTGRPVLVHSPSDSQLLFGASGLHSVTFGGPVYASRPSPECCRQERSPVLGGSEIMLFV